MNQQTRIKKLALNSAIEAGDLILKKYRKFDRGTIRFKSKHEIVTEADIIANKKILAAVQKDFPGHRILSEESGDSKADSDYTWIVDPLDGTTNFSMHNPLWSVSIGITYKKEPLLGVVYAPFLGELYVAEQGKGAKIIDPATGKSKKMSVSSMDQKSGLHAFCHGHDRESKQRALKYYNYQKEHGFDCRQLGSAAIELAYVASGRIESITIPGTNSWDVVAGVLMVREAGGKATDMDNKKWTLDSHDIAASNGKLHPALIKAFKESGAKNF
ncbi:MAG: inositol monophosphatase family protein [Patescibacteria group bacterium]